MARSIKVTWASSHYVYGRDDGVRVRIEVTCASGVTDKIFAYRMLPKNSSGARVGHFSHICSPVDIEEYPETEPTTGTSPEWFRLSFVDVLVRSVEEASQFIDVVLKDVQSIITTLNTMDTMIPTGTRLIGLEDCDATSSSSSSLSSSSDSSLSYSSLAGISAYGALDQSIGYGVAWTNIGTGAGSDITSSDSLSSNRSKVILCPGEASQLLLIQGFDFSEVIDDNIIIGIVADITIRNTTDSSLTSSLSSSSGEDTDCILLSNVSLQHPSFGLSENKATDSCITQNIWNVLTYGGSNDTWGYGQLTGKDIKNGNFGIGITVINQFGYVPSTVEIDGAYLTIYMKEIM